MDLRIWDVEHGACAMMIPRNGGRLAMIDSGCTLDWRPSMHIRNALGRDRVDYLFITNADQDHMSDLNGLWEENITVSTLHRNRQPSAADLRRIKEDDAGGAGLTDDIERFLRIHETYNQPVSEPFNDYMGGISAKSFCNGYPRFQDTNNLSLAVFFKYGGFTILFPGDLEVAGWEALLEQEAFCTELADVDILVAAHHGRENGYCEAIFDYCRPRAVVMSDKAIVHDTQYMAATYRAHVTAHYPNGVLVATTGRQRHVLTTRRDGHIDFIVAENGDFTIETEYRG